MSKSKNTRKKCSTPATPDLNTEIKNEILPNCSTSLDNLMPSSSGRVSATKACFAKSEGSSNDSSAGLNFGRDVATDIGSDYMKNSILEEVLNEKKAALLQSPEVMKLFQEEQLKIQNRNKRIKQKMEDRLTIQSKESRDVTKYMANEFIDVMIKSWTPQSEVWSFKYGSDLLGIMSAVNGSFIMHSIRKQLNLRPFARMTCYLPVAAVSYALTDGFHGTFITRQILGFESCPLCITIKAGLMQASLAVAYPLVLSPLIGFYISDRLLTYPVPSIQRAPKELFNLWLKLITKNTRFVYGSIVIQVFSGCLITSEKQSFFMNFITKKD